MSGFGKRDHIMKKKIVWDKTQTMISSYLWESYLSFIFYIQFEAKLTMNKWSNSNKKSMTFGVLYVTVLFLTHFLGKNLYFWSNKNPTRSNLRLEAVLDTFNSSNEGYRNEDLCDIIDQKKMHHKVPFRKSTRIYETSKKNYLTDTQQN